jgi:hypothetical protein
MPLDALLADFFAIPTKFKRGGKPDDAQDLQNYICDPGKFVTPSPTI